MKKEIKKNTTIKIADIDKVILTKAAEVAFDENIHRKDYGYSAFMVESALENAEKVLGKRKMQEIKDSFTES